MHSPFAFCLYAPAPLRLLPDHRAELTSQLLFGEQVKVLEVADGGWYNVEKLWDGYTGWIRSNLLYWLNDEIPTTGNYAADWVNNISVNGKALKIPFSSPLDVLEANNSGLDICYNGATKNIAENIFDEQHIREIAFTFLNTPYIWGGKTVYGIDCSGFVQSVFRCFGVALQRDAWQQSSQGTDVGFLHSAKVGDVAFFEEKGKITHVGLLLNNHEIIHASGNVRVDKIDSQGIVHSETGVRTHHLRMIKRML